MNNTSTLINQLINGNAQLSNEQHDQLLTEDRQIYAALLRLPHLLPETAMAIIQRLLAVTEIAPGQRVSEKQRKQEDSLITEILPHLPVLNVLQGFLSLVERRVNNQRTSSWMRAYIFGSPQLESWAVNYRQILKRLIRHALGKQVTSTCLYKFALEKTDDRAATYLRRNVLRYAKDTVLAREVFLFLFGQIQKSQFRLLQAYLAARQTIKAGMGLPLKVLRGIRATFHPDTSIRSLRYLARRDKIKRDVTDELETVDESLVGQIRHVYRTSNTALLAQLNLAIEREAKRIPYRDAHVYFILDASASMRGFGHRQYNSIAIAMALLKVFQKRIRQTDTAWIGAKPTEPHGFPQPIGPTSIVPAFLDAVRQSPDLIFFISDGYENVEPGDAAMALAGIKQLGIEIPILHIIPVFTERDKIEQRQPFPDCPIFLETGQRGFLSTWLRIRAHLQPELLPTLLRQTLGGSDEVA